MSKKVFSIQVVQFGCLACSFDASSEDILKDHIAKNHSKSTNDIVLKDRSSEDKSKSTNDMILKNPIAKNNSKSADSIVLKDRNSEDQSNDATTNDVFKENDSTLTDDENSKPQKRKSENFESLIEKAKRQKSSEESSQSSDIENRSLSSFKKRKSNTENDNFNFNKRKSINESSNLNKQKSSRETEPSNQRVNSRQIRNGFSNFKHQPEKEVSDKNFSFQEKRKPTSTLTTTTPTTNGFQLNKNNFNKTKNFSLKSFFDEIKVQDDDDVQLDDVGDDIEVLEKGRQDVDAVEFLETNMDPADLNYLMDNDVSQDSNNDERTSKKHSKYFRSNKTKKSVLFNRDEIKSEDEDDESCSDDFQFESSKNCNKQFDEMFLSVSDILMKSEETNVEDKKMQNFSFEEFPKKNQLANKSKKFNQSLNKKPLPKKSPNSLNNKSDQKKSNKSPTKKMNRNDSLFFCDKCEYSARLNGNLVRHINMIHLKVRFECEGCQKTYSDKRALMRHVQANRGPKSDLLYCSKYTKEKRNLMEELKYDAERNEHNCKICNFSSESEDKCLRHVYRVHNLSRNTLTCKKCQIRFALKNDFIEHLSECNSTQSGSFNLEDPLDLIKKENDSQEQKRIVHAPPRQLTCNDCSFKCNSKKKLKEHISQLHNDKSDISFSSKSENISQLNNDKSNISSSRKPKKTEWKCNDCDYVSYFSLNNLNRHIEVRHLEPNKSSISLSRKPKQTEWKCNDCDYVSYFSVHNLNRHIKVRHLKHRDFMCDHCSTLFTEQRPLDRHLRSNLPDPSDPNDVIHCTKYFTILKNPEDDILHEKDEGEFICLLCDFRSVEKDSTIEHVNTNHKQRAIRVCSKCQSFPGTRGQVKTHWKDCNGEPTSQSKSCFDAKAKSEEQLIEEGKEQSSLDCTNCGEQFGDPISLKKHIHQNRKQISGSEFAMTCKKYTARATEFSASVTEIQESGLFGCSGCDFVTGDKKLGRFHLFLNHRENSRRFGCKICGQKFTSKTKVEDHLRDDHGENVDSKPEEEDESGMLFCDKCSYKSKATANFDRHVRSVHLKEKNFQCGTCGSQYFDKRRLLTHYTAKHANLKIAIPLEKLQAQSLLDGESKDISDMFSCNECSYKSRLAARLDRHFRAVHLGEKNFECKMCGNLYSNKRSLARHYLSKHENI